MKWVHTPLGLPGLAAGMTWPAALALFSFPIFFTKNVINLVQLWKASKILVGVDLAERETARREVLERSRPSIAEEKEES